MPSARGAGAESKSSSSSSRTGRRKRGDWPNSPRLVLLAASCGECAGREQGRCRGAYEEAARLRAERGWRCWSSAVGACQQRSRQRGPWAAAVQEGQGELMSAAFGCLASLNVSRHSEALLYHSCPAIVKLSCLQSCMRTVLVVGPLLWQSHALLQTSKVLLHYHIVLFRQLRSGAGCHLAPCSIKTMWKTLCQMRTVLRVQLS